MPSDADPFDLERFLSAQEGIFEDALAEIRSGRKSGHWMWFVFPQLRGLGLSTMTLFYAIGSLAEAQAYLEHPLLGPRLLRITEAALQAPAASLRELFGRPDDRKFVSCMTLFAVASGEDGGIFQSALDRWRGGAPDSRTIRLLQEDTL